MPYAERKLTVRLGNTFCSLPVKFRVSLSISKVVYASAVIGQCSEGAVYSQFDGELAIRGPCNC